MKNQSIEILKNDRIAVYYNNEFGFIDLRIPASSVKRTVIEMIERGEIQGFYHNMMGAIKAITNDGKVLFESDIF